MLSHPSDPSSEEAAIATATSEMRPAAPNRRRHHITVEEFFSRFDREFFREWFVEGPRLILTGRFTPRDAGFMIAAATPAILSALFLTVPGLLFHTPEHNQFFHFAKIIEGETPSALPVILGTISSICSFRFPLG